MRTKSFDAIYKDAPPDRVDELLAFRSTHPVRQRLIDGIEWNYILCGTGSKTILIMGGPLSTPEMPYRSILNLERDYRVLSLSYSVFDRVDNFLDGLAKLLDLGCKSTSRSSTSWSLRLRITCFSVFVSRSLLQLNIYSSNN